MSPTSITKPDVLHTQEEAERKKKQRFGVTTPELEELTEELTKQKPKRRTITSPRERHKLAEESIVSSRELGIENIESPTRTITRLRPQEKSRLFPSRIQLGVIGKEIGIGIKKGFERAGEKAKKELYKTPLYLERGTQKIGRYAVAKIKEKLHEEAGRTITQRMNIRLPILEKKERIPIFQPRQMKMTREVALFKPNIARLTPKLDITSLPKVNRPMLKRERIRL